MSGLSQAIVGVEGVVGEWGAGVQRKLKKEKERELYIYIAHTHKYRFMAWCLKAKPISMVPTEGGKADQYFRSSLRSSLLTLGQKLHDSLRFVSAIEKGMCGV